MNPTEGGSNVFNHVFLHYMDSFDEESSQYPGFVFPFHRFLKFEFTFL